MYEIRDPIHRTIPFSEREKRVIDHPFVQRLRYVRQLGLSYIVYPGATHDRFSHAVGAMHLAGRMWERIRETSGEVLHRHFSDDDLSYFRQTVRFAGLLHDLGHSPFSHVSESFMPRFRDLVVPRDWFVEPGADRQATHEDYSVLLIAALAEDPSAPLSSDEARDIASLVHHGVTPSESWRKRFSVQGDPASGGGDEDGGRGGIHRLLRSLISGELDCDRMDYLLRDAYFTGVAYGTHDIEHLISNLGVVEGSDGLARTIDSTAVRAFEDFLLARYHMFLQVYMHKTTIAFDWFLKKSLDAGEFALVVPNDAAGYADLRDTTMLERLFTAAKSPENVWARRLILRQPPKLMLVSSNAKPEERELMQKVAGALSQADVPHFTVTTRQYLSKSNSDGKAAALLVRRKLLGRFVYEPIENYSALLNKYSEVIDNSHLYVLREDHEKAMAAVAGV